ncbi:molybdopterin oxidoreductase, membrane subunit [Aeropyrum pernix K1]|uniref:Molybdopterin oxidoreductase, membrane subunit n=1 Tax=Aeropyrum pernix (strain ATCC 700893 / DSM 11879 / JCM 9820 / NBRC 100138 / K1) TaxID=272557 RepID=Q9Y8M5_AERPE|nr:NrfD/PsrC family molybdoenzyme membrane anchor subunit [Aeropyrum pernix]BAA81625.1 molybdopterin oxidoreductase, membrane subunit [Aeropyrum pernix K1]
MSVGEVFGVFPEFGNILPNEMAYDFKAGGAIWGVLLVVYPLMTGILAGSYLVSALAYGFGVKRLYRVAGLSLIISVGLLLSAPIFPMADLKQPQRAFEIFLRPHVIPSDAYPGVSPMAFFGILYIPLLVVALLNLIFVYRADMAAKAEATGNIIYRIVSLGRGYSREDVERDRRVVKILSIIGVILAILFHGYFDILLASIKSRILWVDPSLPIRLLASAVFSGAALVTVAYYIAARFSPGESIDAGTMKTLSLIMLFGLAAALITEITSEILRVGYYLLPGEGIEYYESLRGSMFIDNAYYILALILLVSLLIPRVRENIHSVAAIAALAIVAEILNKWLVVIVPQLLSRTEAGFLEYAIEGWEIRLLVGGLAWTVFVFTILLWIFPWNGEFASRWDIVGEGR